MPMLFLAMTSWELPVYCNDIICSFTRVHAYHVLCGLGMWEKNEGGLANNDKIKGSYVAPHTVRT